LPARASPSARNGSRSSQLDIEHSPVNDQPGYSVVVSRDPDNVELEFNAKG
jgi:hypothetical protein